MKRSRLRALSRGLAQGAASIAALIVTTGASADTIDFESGFADLQSVAAPVATPTNSVTFSIGSGAPGSSPFIAVLGAPETAFFPDDTPNPSGGAGSFFLTDEATAPPNIHTDYFIEFALPVLNLSLDLYDLEVDGNVATLTAYADAARTQVVGSDSVTISGTAPEGLVSTLSIPSPTMPILAADLTISNSIETGVGIDNVSFQTIGAVPVLGMAATVCIATLLGGLSCLAMRQRARR